MGTLYKADGTIQEVASQSRKYTLAEIEAYVRSREIYHVLCKGGCLIVNERGGPHNRRASGLAGKAIQGDALLIVRRERF